MTARAPAHGWLAVDDMPADLKVGVGVIVCVEINGRNVVGEAYLHEESGNWWWANTGPGDYHAEAIFPAPEIYQPMPDPPPKSEGAT